MTQELCFLLVDEFSEIGGAERILLSIAESLKNSGHSVFSVVPGDGSFTTLLQQLGVQVSFVDILGLKGNWLSASKWGEINCQFDMLLDQVRPDVILANSLWAAFTISHSAKKHQCRIVCCVHASIEPKSTLKKIAFPIIRKKLFKPISRWVTVSDNLAEQLFRMGVKRELLEVIPNGVDTDLFRPRTPHKEVRIALPFPENWHIVGTVGRLHPGKGQQVFLKAASIVVQKHPQTCFVIAGKEIVTPSENIHFRESLLELTARLNLTQNVYFAGFHTEVHHLMNCFNSFVSASFEESFG
ncbi:glycosyltransferase, partial [bacterium]|nr:glycosyltransferase [candidate division CSSED10-310 bacterium]